MRTFSPARQVVFVLCCVLVACALAARQTRAQEERQEPAPVPVVATDEAPPPPPEEEEGKSTVFGRVVYADTGRPVRRARRVTLRAGENQPVEVTAPEGN